MSWDLYVLPPEHADEPDEWLEEHAEAPADADAARSHADAVLARCPTLERHVSDDGTVELDSPEDAELPIQLFLDGRHAAVNVPYWDTDATDAAALLQDAVSALVDATGWVVYDPQADEVIATDAVRDALVGGREEGVAAVREITARVGDEPPSKKRKRFFGLF